MISVKKNILLYIFCFSLICAQTTKRVLFLGNSYTSVNNLPQMIASVASSCGDQLIYDSNTPGGYTLQGHSNDANSLNKIAAGTWDFVVLQEQSQLPSFPDGQVQGSVFPYARKLDSLILLANSCTETMFYMTWGRKNGDANNCPVWPPVCTYQGMDSLLYLRYMMMTDSNNAVVSPVGRVWKFLRNNQPLLDLYQSDGSHPSIAGSYAAACCFYTCLFRKNPLNITFNSSLSSNDAALIRSAVKTVVFDSLLNWKIGNYDPQASFNFNTTGNSVLFSNTSTNASQYYWDFGDGNTSTNLNPNHTFQTSGNYTITLIVSKCGLSDTSYAVLNLLPTEIKNINQGSGYFLYPNPSENSIHIIGSFNTVNFVNATDILGKTHELKFKNEDLSISVELSHLNEGIYFLNVFTNEGTHQFKIIKR